MIHLSLAQMWSFLHPRAYQAAPKVRHADFPVEFWDTFLMELPQGYVITMGNGQDRTTLVAEVSLCFRNDNNNQ